MTGGGLGVRVGQRGAHPNEDYWRRALRDQGEVRAKPAADTFGGWLRESIGDVVRNYGGSTDRGWAANQGQHAEDDFRAFDDNFLGLDATQRSYNNIREGRGGLGDYVNVGLVVLPGAAKGVGRLAVRRLARNLEGTAAKDALRATRKWTTESRVPEGAAPRGAPEDRLNWRRRQQAPQTPGMTPRESAIPPEPVHPGSPYLRKQEGPFLVVRRQGAQPQTVPEAEGADLDQLRDILANPGTNEPARIANDYTMMQFGKPYDADFFKPQSSLAKQSGIGRAFQMALEGSPEYKSAIFERYGQTMPQVVEATGAQNYDQLTEAAYRQLVNETNRQFQTLPVEMRYHYGKGEYPVPSAMLQDVLGRGRLNVYRGGDPHPYLNDVDPDTGLTGSEQFRAVHDYFGHGTRGATFRPGGEEIAFASHGQMMSPLALAALATETRGQNSLVNYSPLNVRLYYEMNRVRDQIAKEHLAAGMRGQPKPVLPELNAKLRELGAQTQFAPQIPLLLPPEMLDPAFKGGLPDYVQALSKPNIPLPDQRGVHLSTTPGLTRTDPSFYGTGHRGDDYHTGTGGDGRGGGQTSFYIGPPGTVHAEPWVEDIAKQAYEANLRNLYNMEADPEQLRLLAQSYNLEKMRKGGERRQTAYVPDFARLLHEYGYSGYKNPKFFGNEGAANVFEPIDVVPIEKGPQGYAEGGPVSLPVPGAVQLELPA